MKFFPAAMLLLCMIASCSKYDDTYINGNVPPPDRTIDSATINLYITKAYINLIGREPIQNEMQQAKSILIQNNFSLDDRKQFVDAILAKQEYIRNQYNVCRIEYLQNYDSADIEQQLFVFDNLLTQPQYAPFYDLINYEKNRLVLLKNSANELYAGTLNQKGMLKRMADNYFYDQINMGTENFVVSTFQNFLFRYPSDAELANGKTMVDGNTATIFLQLGKSKTDYLNIFFDTPDYYEGQVRFIFKKYLFRDASPAEIAYYGNVYKSSGNYKNLQREIFSLPEYAGLK